MTRLSQTLSGRPAARPQSPRAISQVREKCYDRMGFGPMHTALRYHNEAVISCLTASGEIRDDCHSNRVKQGSYRYDSISSEHLKYKTNITYLVLNRHFFNYALVNVQTRKSGTWSNCPYTKRGQRPIRPKPQQRYNITKYVA